jgi:hypothetical protein
MNAILLRHLLSQSGLRPDPSVISRIPLVEEALASSLSAEALLTPAVHNNHPGHRLFKRDSRLGELIDALRCHFTGGRPRLSSTFVHLATYAAAYVWEKDDRVPDEMACGLEDDLNVVQRVISTVADELDSFVLARNRVASPAFTR